MRQGCKNRPNATTRSRGNDLAPWFILRGQKLPCYTGSMVTNISSAFRQLSDQDVLARVRRAVQDERGATVQLIALLMELDVRRLYLGEGCSSLFTYCTQVLHLAEHAAYNRIEAARAARRFPLILDLIESGAVTLATVRLLAPHLTTVNHRELLERARHKSKRDVELLVATLNPRPDAPSLVRKLPTPAVAKQPAIAAPPQAAGMDASRSNDAPLALLPSSRRAEVKPLAPERYKIQITVSRQTYDMLLRAQDLLRHTVPNGDPAVIFERAIGLLVVDLERTKLRVTQRPRVARATKTGSRHIPAALRRAVWNRDGGRCAFNGPQGRCTETGFLEYHHVVPFASGGETSADNLELRCRLCRYRHKRHYADWRIMPRSHDKPTACGVEGRLLTRSLSA